MRKIEILDYIYFKSKSIKSAIMIKIILVIIETIYNILLSLGCALNDIYRKCIISIFFLF